MSDSRNPATVVPPDWQHWQVTATETWLPPEYGVEATFSWWSEALVAGLVAVYSLLLGGVVGLVWPHFAPHIRLVDAVFGSEAATKALLGDDLWLALVAGIAGVVAVIALWALSRGTADGPGSVVGLAVGGLLGSLVAAQVGHLAQHPNVLSVLHTWFPTITRHSAAAVLSDFDFRVRAKAVLMAWPFTAVVAQAAVVGLRLRWPSRLGPPAERPERSDRPA